MVPQPRTAAPRFCDAIGLFGREFALSHRPELVQGYAMSRLLEHCSDLPLRSYSRGDFVLKEGEKDGEILFLREGSVEVQKEGSAITTISAPGAMLGEIAVLLDCGHSASAIALKDSSFFVLEDAAEALSSNPLLHQEISKVLARRLVRASESASEWMKKAEFEEDLGDFEMMMLWDEMEMA